MGEVIINILTIAISVVIAVYTVKSSWEANFRQSRLERRFDVYAELAGYLQQVTANHENAIRLRSKIFGLITKTYFFASDSINELFQEFLDEEIYDKEIKKVDIEGNDRDTSFNEFDAYIFTLIESMKYESKQGKDISLEELKRIKEEQLKNLTKKYI